MRLRQFSRVIKKKKKKKKKTIFHSLQLINIFRKIDLFITP